MSQLILEFVNRPEDVAKCLQLRREVFIEEQGISEAEEMDGMDAQCAHVLAHMKGVPVGAARVHQTGEFAKIQRVCIARSHRGMGAGARLMEFIVDELKKDGRISFVCLGAQTHALAFYERLGFTAEGPIYLDAGIEHRTMSRAL